MTLDYDPTGNRYVERTALQGRLQIEPVLPSEDGGTGARWGAAWAPSMDALPDIDAAEPTLEAALIGLVYGMGETILDLRRGARVAATEPILDDEEPTKHYGELDSFPPYVGGDDDEIDEWQATCFCGYRGRKTAHVSVAYGELVSHLNESFRAKRSGKAAT